MAERTAELGQFSRRSQPSPTSACCAELDQASTHLKAEMLRRREAEAANAVFAAVVEHSNDAIYAHQLDGTITIWNAAAQRIFGYTAEDIRAKSLSILLPRDRSDETAAILRAIERGEVVEHFETQRIRKDGRRIDVSLTISPIKDAAGRVVGASRVARDITRRREMERALAESQAKAQAILDTAVDAIITMSERGAIEQINAAAEQMFGYSESELAGRNIKVLMPSPYHGEHDHYLEKYLETGKARIIGGTAEVQGLRKDGTIFPIEVTVGEVRLGERRLFTGIVRDLTRRRRLQREILETGDRERRRIGEDLHDSLGQLLTGIGFMGKSLEQRLSAKRLPEANDAKQITDLVTQAIAQARALARGLHPVQAGAGGLMTALQDLAQSTQTLFRVRSKLECSKSVVLNDAAAATHLYRIAQEAVSNAVKHGKPNEILIRLCEDKSHVRLTIENDGVPFPPQLPQQRGMGFHTMRHRASLLGAALTIGGGRGGTGTCVSCAFPRLSTEIGRSQ